MRPALLAVGPMTFTPVQWRIRTCTLTTADHTLIMGVLNVTPDSFSDGGRLGDVGAAVAEGLRLWGDGADIVDVGGESTRPGARPVAAAEEAERVVPVVRRLVEEGVVVSVDTSKPVVAEAALAAGAEVVNDISAFRDPDMARVCAAAGAGVVLMHMRGTPADMQDDPRYDDVVAEVAAALASAAATAAAAGIEPVRIAIDPGIGFGKTYADNLALLAGLGRFVASGHPVVVGASRKRFLGWILERAGHPAPPAGRDAATGATTVRAVDAGVAVVRVHNVASALQVARTADAIVRSRSDEQTE